VELQLAGKTAVVTGGSKGIGFAVTEALVAEGVSVTVGARHISRELADLAKGGLLHPVEVDLATPDGPAYLMEQADSAFGGLDILVNNVGSARPRTAGFLSVTDADWADALNINLLAAVRATRAALPLMLGRPNGAIVTVGSVNSTLPDPLVIDYSAAKAALASFTKSLSKELGPQGIRVNIISPGPVATALWLGDDGVAATVGAAMGVAPGAVADTAAQDSVTGRFTKPHEVADLVLMLASSRTANVTGANFAIDGGLITTI
jgi:NAD(P)-dependent dehydrogenase (short-subunit alcohol dehydrogenase family)